MEKTDQSTLPDSYLKEKNSSATPYSDEFEERKISLFAENMTLQERILNAGGFKEGASVNRVEIFRRVRNSNVLSQSAATAEIFQVNLYKNLRFLGAPFILQPFDIVSVRSALGYEVQRQVKIQGEVLYPGTYTILRKDERISDIVKRAGGLTALAYTRGASLKRLGVPDTDSAEVQKEKLAKLKRFQSSAGHSSVIDIDSESTVRNINVGISLQDILEFPGSLHDLILEKRDIVNVPKQLQRNKVSREVLSPITIIYEKGRGFRDYISHSGGLSDRSLKRGSYILYANGSVKIPKKIFFFNDYPRVDPGAEIFVPKKTEKKPLSAAEIVGISTGLGYLAVNRLLF